MSSIASDKNNEEIYCVEETFEIAEGNVEKEVSIVSKSKYNK